VFTKERKAEGGRSAGLGGHSTLDALKEIDYLQTHNGVSRLSLTS
jgi:hypothetical protein